MYIDTFSVSCILLAPSALCAPDRVARFLDSDSVRDDDVVVVVNASDGEGIRW